MTPWYAISYLTFLQIGRFPECLRHQFLRKETIPRSILDEDPADAPRIGGFNIRDWVRSTFWKIHLSVLAQGTKQFLKTNELWELKLHTYGQMNFSWSPGIWKRTLRNDACKTRLDGGCLSGSGSGFLLVTRNMDSRSLGSIGRHRLANRVPSPYTHLQKCT